MPYYHHICAWSSELGGDKRQLSVIPPIFLPQLTPNKGVGDLGDLQRLGNIPRCPSASMIITTYQFVQFIPEQHRHSQNASKLNDQSHLDFFFRPPPSLGGVGCIRVPSHMS